MSATTTVRPAPFSTVTAAHATPPVTAAVAAAKDLPDLVNKLQVVDPALAQQLEGKTLIASKSPLGTVIGLGVGWAVAHFGLACSAATAAAAGCWSQNTVDIATGAACIAGTAIAAYVMRIYTTSPISGWLSKAATPTQQAAVPLSAKAAVSPTP